MEDEESQDEFGNNLKQFDSSESTDSCLLQNSQPRVKSQDNLRINQVLSEEIGSSTSLTLNITINRCIDKPTEILRIPNNDCDAISEPKTSLYDISNQILRIEERKHLWDGSVRKHKSPSIDTVINKSAPCKVTIDEGSEINVVDHKFCLRWKIRFSPLVHAATAAGSSTMKVEGQTVHNVILQVPGKEVVWDCMYCDQKLGG